MIRKNKIGMLGKWFVLVLLVAVVGCSSLGGLDLNKALLSGFDTTSMQGNSTISLELKLDPKKQPDDKTKAMVELLNGMKVELKQLKMESRERMSIAGQLTLAKGAIPFQLFAAPDRMVLKIDGAPETMVFPFGLSGVMPMSDGDLMFSEALQSIMAKYKEKGIDKTYASLIVNNLPNPKSIGVSSGTETIHNEQVNGYKLETTIGGSELLPLLKTFIRNLTKDDQMLRQLVSQLYDVVWPVVEPYLKQGALELPMSGSADPFGSVEALGPVEAFGMFGGIRDSLMDVAADKELAVDMLHTLVKQVLYIAYIGVDSMGRGENNPIKDILGDKTYAKAKLFFDRDLALRKSDIELSVGPQSEDTSGISAIVLRIASEYWELNKPVKADVVEAGAKPFILGKNGTFLEWMKTIEPSSLLGELLADEIKRQSVPPFTYETKSILIPVGEAGTALGKTAYIENGTAYAALDMLALKMDADAAYNGDTATITTYWDSVIELTIGSSNAIIDGESYEMDGTVRKHNGLVYVPCRFIAEELGGYVWFDEEQNVIVVEWYE
ncbi:copper amine oxidase N-terminal domain-containing protein [Paenibacillus ginsengarvi]|uniref:copper amine oxidase N-terminal domain-containing protein n=1 Tax=Paenibacillus ginsengarvi TaxID=400777 RepID=UPI0013156D83|nr:copper amine oxidase N-terminal domain-containing protein [Paenibacillus ginsengarvi]